MPTADPPVASENASILELTEREYKAGFVTDIESETIPPGLSEDVVRLISAKKNEPEWLLEWRLKAYRHWLTMKEPTWANVHYPPIDYQAIIYYSAPEGEEGRAEEPRRGRPGAARDVREARHPARRAGDARRRRGRRGLRQRLGRDDVQGEAGEARHHLLLVLRGGARATRTSCRSTSARSCPTPTTSSRRSTPRSSPTARSATSRRACAARWSSRPTSASTRRTPGQFERTLIVADEGAYVSATSRAARRRCATRTSCTRRSSSSSRSTTRRSSTRPCRTGTPATRTARAASTTSSPSAASAAGRRSKISWTQVETGSAITWKYPSCILQGDDSVGEFYSVAVDEQLPAGRHRHEDDPHRQEHAAARSSRRASRPATARTPTAAW